ncbi:MAG: HlyD family efflux transporter periplasmic adaptor subunit, partial [Alphaproteobacteria bacterium]|nr:HlyD family efflux transporter periplasmic adaptor subunit [Alphaproteobacteria bacterium]
KLERQSKDLIIRSPVDGTILDLPTISQGSIVREGEPIMTLVRSNVPLARIIAKRESFVSAIQKTGHTLPSMFAAGVGRSEISFMRRAP